MSIMSSHMMRNLMYMYILLSDLMMTNKGEHYIVVLPLYIDIIAQQLKQIGI